MYLTASNPNAFGFQIKTERKITDLCFDTGMKSDNATFSNNNKTVTKTSGGYGAWNCGVLMNMKVEKFRVRILQTGPGNEIMIGFAPKNTFQVNGLNFNRSGWYIYSHNGCLYSQAGDGGSRALYGKAIVVNDIVEVSYNANAKTISFKVNQSEFQNAFQNVTGDLYPALELSSPGASLEIV